MKANVVYLSHGGGPLPLLGDPSHRAMVRFMRQLGEDLPRPKAIVVVSAHWEEEIPTLTASPSPPLLYDYYGFPKEAYEITYPAMGSPALAKKIADLLGNAVLDEKRGFDHGMFIPLSLMYPDASIPTIQISLLSSLSAAEHWRLGEKLRPLLDEDILFIGSGFSFHNMRQFWREDDEQNHAFQDFLIETCCMDTATQNRKQALIQWERAPYARYCHPREEHLLPLLVCQSLAGGAADLIFDDKIIERRAVAFHWS
ncbi:MAG: class III extradiol ring-cleavage dioxygenase [Sphaerochaetaceae bacterium]|nr:class III extradiol ring-cleavage dioxygenase [Sphaerochaetaceae bacterium]